MDGHSFASREAGKRRFRDTAAQHGAKRTCKFRNRTGLSQGAVLREWLDTVVKPAFEGRILPIDEATAEICAALHIPDHAPENDSWIAATAKQHRLILVTRNIKDMDRAGVKLLNPFEAA
ncbi:PIN domain-containing protein [Kingella denitrificans]|nr:PIN domain-containing protein [Kingella denitrificans]